MVETDRFTTYCSGLSTCLTLPLSRMRRLRSIGESIFARPVDISSSYCSRRRGHLGTMRQGMWKSGVLARCKPQHSWGWRQS
eukprot:5230063-Prymnesium_polylepis.2